jgi:hypothetical protein
MSKFGNPKLLKEKYGELSTQKDNKIIHEKAKQITKIKQELKITLPDKPSLILPSIKVFEEIEINPIDKSTTDSYKHNLLNYIDVSKLNEGRPGFKSKSYFLSDLIHFSKMLGIFKNEKGKGYFIEKIKDEIKNNIGEINLVGDIKELSNDDVKDFKNIQNLFNKHYIAQPDYTKLLNNIKSTIKKFYTSDAIVQEVINVLEKEWKPVKK